MSNTNKTSIGTKVVSIIIGGIIFVFVLLVVGGFVYVAMMSGLAGGG